MKRQRAPARRKLQIRQHTDDETGVITESLTIGSSVVPLQNDELALIDEFLRETNLSATSFDFVLGPWEAALREGRWQPPNADELLRAIDVLRSAVQRVDPAQTVAVRGVRVGRLWAEAVAKTEWPIIGHGRSARRGRSAGRTSPKRSQPGADLLDDIEAIKQAATQPLSDASAARMYLARDPAWDALERDEQDRNVRSLRRRLSRARAKKHRRLEKTDDVP